MEKYNSGGKCPKCGSTNCDTDLDKDLILRSCGRCRAQWHEEPLDVADKTPKYQGAGMALHFKGNPNKEMEKERETKNRQAEIAADDEESEIVYDEGIINDFERRINALEGKVFPWIKK